VTSRRRPVAPGARRVLLIACALACGACAGDIRPAPEPWPDALGDSRRPVAAAPSTAPLEGWDLAAALERSRKIGDSRGPSQHFGGGAEAEVLADAAATPYPTLPAGRRLPAGATVIERLFDAGAVKPRAIFVMTKRQPGFDPAGDDWEYLALTPTGDVTSRGRLPFCARCHAEAVHDHLFGPPRGP
jgi:hypothetical protein